jgi:uncharacterized protein YjbJ (UPF0337 family)
LTGAPSWQQSGREEHRAGEAEVQAAKAKAYAEGAADRVQGKYDAVAGAVTGDRTREMQGMHRLDFLLFVSHLIICLVFYIGNARQDAGKAQQQMNK